MSTKKKKAKPLPRGRNGGRKPKKQEATATFAFRAPASLLAQFKAAHGKGVGKALTALIEADLRKYPLG